MNTSFFVGDNTAAKRIAGWGVSIGRMVLPATLFAVSVLGALTARDGNVLADRVVLIEASQLPAVHLENATVRRER